MNVELLRKVQEVIREEPRRLRMGFWASKERDPLRSVHIPPCGTEGCIAGWATMLSSPEKSPLEIGHSEGERALELSPTESSNLFYVENWPREFSEPYVALGKSGLLQMDPLEFYRKRAEITCNRIDHFITTGE